MLIFDFDGVIAHLKLPAAQMKMDLQRIFHRHGFFAPDFTSLYEALFASLQKAKAHDEMRGNALERDAWAYIDTQEDQSALSAKPVPQIETALRRLAHFPKAIVSNNSREAIISCLSTIGIEPESFASIKGRQGGQLTKPSPVAMTEIFQEQHLLCPVKKVFVMGDHETDMHAMLGLKNELKNMHVDCHVVGIGVLGGRCDAESLEASGARFVATDPIDVEKLISTPPARQSLSVTLLAYNEERLLEKAVEDIHFFAQDYLSDYEIVIVDDGSRDNTARLADTLKSTHVKVIHHDTNYGMGRSIRDGYGASEKDFLTFLPGDRQVRAHSLVHLIPHMAPDTLVHSQYLHFATGPLRVFVSWVFRFLCRNVAGLSQDFAGTYVISRHAFAQIPAAKTGVDSFLYSFQVLAQVKTHSPHVKTVFIHPYLRSVGQSRVFKLSKIISIMKEMVTIRLARILRGRNV